MSNRFPHRWNVIQKLSQMECPALQYTPSRLGVQYSHQGDISTFVLVCAMNGIFFLPQIASGFMTAVKAAVLMGYIANFLYTLFCPYPWCLVDKLIDKIQSSETEAGVEKTPRVWLYFYYVIMRQYPNAGWSSFVIRQVVNATPLLFMYFYGINVVVCVLSSILYTSTLVLNFNFNYYSKMKKGTIL